MVGVSEDWAKKTIVSIGSTTYKLVGISDWSSHRGTRITIELHVVEEKENGEKELKESKLLFSDEINEGKFLTGEFGSSDVWEIYGKRFMQIFEEQKRMLEKSLNVNIEEHKIRILNHDTEKNEIRLDFDGREVEIKRVFNIPLPEKTSYKFTLEITWNEKTGEIYWRDKAEEAYANTYMLLKKYFGTPEHFTYPNSSDIGSKYTLQYKEHLFHIIINHYSMSIRSDAPRELCKEFDTIFRHLVKASQYDEDTLSKLIKVTRIRRPKEYWEERQKEILEKIVGTLSGKTVIDYWAFKPIVAIENTQYDVVGVLKWTRNVGTEITIELHNYEESIGSRRNLIGRKILFTREVKDGRFVTGKYSKRDVWKMLGRKFRQLCQKQKDELKTYPGAKVLEYEIKTVNLDERSYILELELDGQLVKIERVPDDEAKSISEGEFYGYKLEWIWDNVTGRPLGQLESLRMESHTRFALRKYFGEPLKLDSEGTERFILKYKGYPFHVVMDGGNPIYSNSPRDVCREFYIILCWLTKEFRRTRYLTRKGRLKNTA